MNAGDVVRVYKKPLTEEDFEGEATLINKLGDRGDCQDWLVEFSGGFRALRTIAEKGVKP